MRTLTKLNKAPTTVPAKSPGAAPDQAPGAAPAKMKGDADVGTDSTEARRELEGRIQGASLLARDTQTPGSAGHSQAHESAVKHVTGRAAYIDDLKAPADCLHLALALSPVAHGRLTRLDLDRVRALAGVVDAVGFDDVPGHTDIGPVFPGDPIFVGDEISYAGQVIFAVAAESHRAAREAVKAALDAGVVEIDERPASLDPVAAAERSEFVRPTHVQQGGDWRPRWQAPAGSWKASSSSGARSTSIWRARPAWSPPPRTRAWWSTPPTSTPARPRSWWPRCWASPSMR